MGKSLCCEKVGLRKGKWTTEEDETLVNYIQSNGEGSWKSLPKNAGLLRCGKSCRLRWINYLRGDLKRGNFSIEEEEIIVMLHKAFGNRWSTIASHLPGRTDNEIKNYWNSHLSRQSYRFFTNKNKTKTSIDIATLDNQQKRRVGRVSRCVTKKYNKKPLSATNKSMDKQVDENVEDCSNFVTKHMKESQVHSNVISGKLESMHSGGVSSTTVEDQIEQWLIEVEAENLEENERNVDERDKSLSLDSTKTWISCYNETEWDTKFDFTGLNTCDGEDDMLVWLWEGQPQCDHKSM